jgi:hypothetical protein
MMKYIIPVALFLVYLTSHAPSAHAQYAVDQPQTLEGLERVLVVFADPANTIGPDRANEFYNLATLELRKAGLRIIQDPEEFDVSRDGILNLAFVGSENTLTTDLNFRMDVEQGVILQRTNKPYRLVTWYYEKEDRVSDYRAELQPMLVEGLNSFLNDWLSANGR